VKNLETGTAGVMSELAVGDLRAYRPVAAAKHGDAVSHGESAEHSSTRLKRLACSELRRTGCSDPAGHSGEVVSEAHVKLLEHRDRFNSPERALYRITINEARTHARKCRRELAHEIHEGEIPAFTQSLDPTEMYETAILIEELLARLDEVDQTIISLRFVGLEFEQIAEELGMEGSTVRSRYCRAVKQLKKINL
jgi:RNA polymerase sigma factor (sigma-70 family)